MRTVLAGTYVADFKRNRQLRRLLELGGHEVDEVRVDLWPQDRVGAVQAPKGRLLAKAAAAYFRLLIQLIRMPRPDVVIVGYPGWFDVPLVALVCRIRGIPVLFDIFISLYETAVVDRALLPSTSIAGRVARFADRLACRAADRVLIDTEPHGDYVARLTGIDRTKIGVLPVGADEVLFAPRPMEGDVRRVIFQGTFVPLHGLPTIVEAAALLRDEDVQFVILGDGQESRRVAEMIETLQLDNVERIGLVPLEDLPGHLARSALVLGVFSNSEKADLVVPNKVFEGIAMAQPVITASTSAIRSEFRPGELEQVPPEDPLALANSIRRLLSHREERENLARLGRSAFVTRFSEDRLAQVLADEIRSIRPQ